MVGWVVRLRKWRFLATATMVKPFIMDITANSHWLEQWRRRTGSCFIAHSWVSRPFQGASAILSDTVPTKSFCSLIVGSVKAWMNCSPGFVKNTKLVLIDLITDKLTGFTFAKSSWRFWRFDWFLDSYFIKRQLPPVHHETLQEKWSCLKQNIAKYVMWLRRFSWP